MPDSAVPSESVFDRRARPRELSFSTWAAPDGWPHRAFRWPEPAGLARGSILFQSGRASFIEKEMEACDHWWRRGWRVEGFDWRGQGGSGRLTPGGPADDRASFDPLIDDLAAYVADWRERTPGPHVLIAHSMGGHIGLRLMAERGVGFDAAVLVAPMLALSRRPVPGWLQRIAIRAALLAGLRHRAAWREMRDDPRRQVRLTTDIERFHDIDWWKRADPMLDLGPPSWGWLAAAMAGERRIAADPLEKVTTPILFLAPSDDKLVDNAAIVSAAKRLPDAELKLFPGAAHELLREADRYRLPALAAIDAFLDARGHA
ncbi:MAG TPA: alpha/beta hydrolase [Sphingomonas sp.]|nr:alpha/beta hydrolase [Sphingomonas sp.]